MAKNTLLNQVRNLRTEAEAYEFVERLRWKGNPSCPHCGSEKVYFLTPKGEGRKTRTGKVSERRVWKCANCRKQFSVLTGTIFHGTKVELRIWLSVVVEMCANKNGMAAREIERKYGVAPKTAWFMAHRIREAMRNRAPHALRGVIVADEAWIGGDPERMNRKTHAKWAGRGENPAPVVPGGGGRPNQKTAKTPIVSLVDAATGEVRSAVVPRVNSGNLRKFMAQNVDMAGSVLWTDEAKVYSGSLGREFIRHETVDHEADEYVGPNGQSTNLAESYFSQFKRSLDGTHHRVSVEHLHRYLGEFDYRRSTCKISDTERVERLMGQVEGRLSYKRITE
jgi:transposase-like protein